MTTDRLKRRLMLGSALAATLAVTGSAAAEGRTSVSPQQQQTTSEQRSDVQPTAGQESDKMMLSEADTERVKGLQRELASRGLYQAPVDGIAGPKTRAALRNFQSQQGIAASGELDARTADALGLDWERQPVRGTESEQTDVQRQPGETAAAGVIELSALNADQIKTIQTKLQEAGLYNGEIDGVVGPQTRAALQRHFQRQAQLAAQGKLSDSGIEAFGMDASQIEPVRGGETSGVQEPAPARHQQPMRQEPVQEAPSPSRR